MATERARSTSGEAPDVSFRSGGRRREFLGLMIAVVAGVGMAAQSRINGELGHRLDDAVLAAVISFGSGLVLLVAAVLVSARMRAGLGRARTALRTRALRPWHFLGGLAGATYVLGQSVTVVLIGVAMFTVGVVAGQTVSSLAVDRFGLGPAGARAITWPRVLGAALMVVAVGIGVGGAFLDAEADRVWVLVLPMVAGVGMAVQQAFNGRVGEVAGSPFTAALVNFTAGTAALVVLWGVSLATSARSLPEELPTEPVLYLGGVVGVVFIAVASVLVAWTGVLLFGLASVTGQLLGSVVLDLVVPATEGAISPATLIGCGVALVAVVVATVGGRRGGGGSLEESAP